MIYRGRCELAFGSGVCAADYRLEIITKPTRSLGKGWLLNFDRATIDAAVLAGGFVTLRLETGDELRIVVVDDTGVFHVSGPIPPDVLERLAQYRRGRKGGA